MVLYDDALVLAKPRALRRERERLGAMSPGQVAGLHPKNRLISLNHISDVDVWERRAGGQVTLWNANGSRQAFSWSALSARHVDVTALLTDAMPAKVDLVAPGAVIRIGRIAVRVAGVVVAVVALKLGLGVLMKSDPPPSPSAPPSRVLTPAQQALNAELNEACAPWTALVSTLAPGQRPDPARLRPVVDGMRPRLAAAASADASLSTAVSELGWLQAYSQLPAPDAGRESAARIAFAIQQVDTACRRAS